MTTRPGNVPPLGLAEARHLVARREWRALAERAALLEPDALSADPELGYHCANAWMRIGALQRGLELAREVAPRLCLTGDRRLALQGINLLGALLFETGLTAEAEDRFGELLERATDEQDDELAARASNNLGVLANVRGDRERALTCYQRALASYQRLGYIRGLAQTHYNLGMAYRELRFAEQADAHYGRAIRFAEQSGSADVIGLAESDRGLLCVQSDDPAKGEALAMRARDRFASLGDPLGVAEALRVVAAAQRALGRLDQARRLLDEALGAARAHASVLLLAELQRDRGRLLVQMGDESGAREAFNEAAESFSFLGARADAEATRLLPPTPAS
ncbi:MAG: tetratricopeptide repeat protein [Gemmatimonadetes bacterium]|nr:tetratricopeptide repeat protein [Gemmatimonadota bacterium]